MNSIRILTLAGLLLICVVGDKSRAALRYMEKLDRGVVAVHLGGSQVFVSWRLFGTDPEAIGFNLYRGSVKVNSSVITGSTNFTDTAGSLSSMYTVRPVLGGIEQDGSVPVVVWAQPYHSIPMQIPAGFTTPDGVTCTYSPGDSSVGDLDGDGQYEIVVKWDPSNSKDNSQSGYTGKVYLDAYELDGTLLWRVDLGVNIRAGAHYTQFMVYDLDSDGKAEVACKTADGTVDGQGTILGDPAADYRNTSGYILSGPEYLSVFDGQTGAFLDTVCYVPLRGTVSDWGDSYGNRVDRFLACVACLDGQTPSLVMCRGYYTRAVLAAWDFRNGKLAQRWVFDTNNGYSAYRGQGNHNLSVGDVDADGFDEIVYGSCAIDHDGTGLYTTGLGHGDAMHLSDLDPARPGLESYHIHEGSTTPGSSFQNAATGQIYWQTANTDIGRGVAADIDDRFPGYECWGTGGLHKCTGEQITTTNPPSTNFVIWWDGDLTRELLDAEKIDKWLPLANNGAGGNTRLLTAYNYGAENINGTKNNPCVQADILGDWREEVIWRHYDNTRLLVFTTTVPTGYRFYTLMHDPQYRLSIAWQNVAYNQPPHTSFYFGAGMSPPPVPPIQYPQTGPGGLLQQWWLGIEGNAVRDLTMHANYPDQPSGSDQLSRFEGISDRDENFGTRVRGWLVPPKSGHYQFWAAANESAELWLSGDAMAENAALIASVPAWTNPRQWNKYPDQQSALIPLQAGHKYYIELLHKEGTGSDHFAVAWQGPALGQQVIESDYLVVWFERLAGDFNGSERIDFKDFAILTSQWLIADCALGLYEDLNGDCQINLPDLLILGENWLYGASALQVQTIRIQENETGFVAVNGTIDSNNAGFTGTGFANSVNAVGGYVDWSVNVPDSGTYQLQWRYANGAAADRTAGVSVNDVPQSDGISFPATGSWTTWTLSFVADVNLTEGNNTIRLAAETANGLANIDWIEITGLSPRAKQLVN